MFQDTPDSTATALITSQVYGILLWAWLGGKDLDGGEAKCGRLLTIEEVGEVLKGMSASHHHQGHC